MVGLANEGRASLTASMIFGGLYNIYSGYHFRIPMCVQPMKTIAAVALTYPLTLAQVASAGIFTSFAILLLGATNSFDKMARLLPISLVRGIQLGTSLQLMAKAGEMVSNSAGKWGFFFLDEGQQQKASLLLWVWCDNYWLAILALGFSIWFIDKNLIGKTTDEIPSCESEWEAADHSSERACKGRYSESSLKKSDEDMILVDDTAEFKDERCRELISKSAGYLVQKEGAFIHFNSIQVRESPTNVLSTSISPGNRTSLHFASKPYSPSHVPTALILVTICTSIAILHTFLTPAKDSLYFSPPCLPNLVIPTLKDFSVGIVAGASGQIPLTALNSVIAVSFLADELYPCHRKPVVVSRDLAVSIGVMNLIGCWFGSIPFCHGSGGLAGQFHFGSRTGGGVMMLGAAKLFLGLVFGDSLSVILKLIPSSVLGVMMFLCGLELSAAACRISPEINDVADVNFNLYIMLITAGAQVAFKHAGIGFVCGMLFFVIGKYRWQVQAKMLL